MLCIWWDQRGVVYYELLQPNETITAERYQQQLMQLSRALKFNRPQYAKRHDNARPHVAKVVKETLEALDWDVLPRPPYSPDIASLKMRTHRSYWERNPHFKLDLIGRVSKIILGSLRESRVCLCFSFICVMCKQNTQEVLTLMLIISASKRTIPF